MNRSILLPLAALFFITTTSALFAVDEFKPEPGYASLFNGHNFTGWGYLTNHFDSKTASDDGRFSASDGTLVVHPRTPRLIQKIWTTQTFSNDFNLRLEFRASTNADSGIYILECRM